MNQRYRCLGCSAEWTRARRRGSRPAACPNGCPAHLRRELHRCEACAREWGRVPTKGQAPKSCPDCHTPSGGRKSATRCRVCGTPVVKDHCKLAPSNPSQVVCSHVCRGVLQTGLGYFPSRRDFERFQARATPTLVRFACAECGEQCERLWYTGASEPRFCSKPCSSRARSRERDYRERAATTTDAPIDRAAILARDNFVCYLCGSTTDPEDWEPTRGRDGRLYRRIGPRYPTLDHVVALARGGEHAESNLRCACFDCNTRKGAQ